MISWPGRRASAAFGVGKRQRLMYAGYAGAGLNIWKGYTLQNGGNQRDCFHVFSGTAGGAPPPMCACCCGGSGQRSSSLPPSSSSLDLLPVFLNLLPDDARDHSGIPEGCKVYGNSYGRIIPAKSELPV